MKRLIIIPLLILGLIGSGQTLVQKKIGPLGNSSTLVQRTTGVNYNTTIADTIPTFILTATGTGAGVSTLKMYSSAVDTLKFLGNARFYDDAGGTINPTTSRVITAGSFQTFYYKLSLGTDTLKFTNAMITKWGDATNVGLANATNAPSIAGDISKFSRCISFNFPNAVGALSGEIINKDINYCKFSTGASPSLLLTNKTKLTWVQMPSTAVVTGDISLCTLLTYFSISDGAIASQDGHLFVPGGTSQSNPGGDISGLVNMVTFNVYGNNTFYGSIQALTKATTIVIAGNNTIHGYTSGKTWPNSMALIYLDQREGYGMTSTEVDNLLIDLSAKTWLVGSVVFLPGPNAVRTSASDAAVATLKSKTVYVYTSYPAPILCFNLDDGRKTDYTVIRPMMAAKGWNISHAICGGGPYAINGDTTSFLSWWKVKQLIAAGDGFQDHTWDHPDLTTLTPAQIITEIHKQDSVFILNSIDTAKYLIYPAGKNNATVQATIAPYRLAARAFGDGETFRDGVIPLQMGGFELSYMATPANAKNYANRLAVLKRIIKHRSAAWFFMHEVTAGSELQTDLQSLMDYIQSQGYSFVTIESMYSQISPYF